MSRLVVRLLRVLVVVLGLLTVVVQVLLVVSTVVESAASGGTGRDATYAAVAVAVLVCGQAGIVAIGVLLAMVQRDAIFDEHAFRWVAVLPVAGLVAALLVAGVCVHAGELDDSPGLVLIGGAIGVAGIAFALLMVVMRGLLRNATVLRRELEQVV